MRTWRSLSKLNRPPISNELLSAPRALHHIRKRFKCYHTCGLSLYMEQSFSKLLSNFNSYLMRTHRFEWNTPPTAYPWSHRRVNMHTDARTPAYSAIVKPHVCGSICVCWCIAYSAATYAHACFSYRHPTRARATSNRRKSAAAHVRLLET